MIKVVVYYALLATTFLFALYRGGEVERVVAWGAVLASISTSFVLATHAQEVFSDLETAVLFIDILYLAALVVVAAYANRFWPIWFSALQLLAVAVHVGRLHDGPVLPVVYARAVADLAYPALTILIIGTWRHSRRGAERDWSWQ